MQNHGRNPKKVNNIFVKQFCHLWGYQFHCPGKHRNQRCELTILAYTTDEPIVTMNHWHTKHEANSPPLEFLVWQGQGLQKASQQSVDIFDALANHTALDKCSKMLR